MRGESSPAFRTALRIALWRILVAVMLATAGEPESRSSPGAPPTSHWAFRPVRRPPLPSTRNTSWARSPVDAFILARFESEGISPAPETDRRTLIRRLSLDLRGLPPTPEEVDSFLADSDSSAYDRLVDRLLDSPHFGERWARHWLDVARYGDTDGYEDDKFRPDAWRYRDWVIEAINRDLPYDQFTIWQIAGDLLPSPSREQRLATGFHRMTLSNNAGAGGIQEEYRVKAVKDRLTTTATAWLGLTVGCAECHDHKYDPISLADYYRLYGFFNSTEELSLPSDKPGSRYETEYQEALQAFERRLADARHALESYERERLPAAQHAWESSAKNDPTLPDAIRSLLGLPAERRDPQQQTELTRHFRSLDPEYARLKALVPMGDEVGNNRPAPPSEKALVIGENPAPRKSFVQRRGNFLAPGPEVTNGIPEFLPPLRPRQSPPDRLDLARWIVDPANPLASRVAVNHWWQTLFGRGLVPTSDNFGVKGEAPSHPELLDWLASELMARGWSRKALIREIVRSAAYRQSSQRRPEIEIRDPNNAWLSRQNRLRVEAECVRDLALAASGLLSPEIGGPSFQPPVPASLLSNKELKNERFMETSPASHRYRRGIYINVQRTFLFPMLRTFDVADANVACTRRDRSNTPLQALTLLNDPVFWEAAQALAARAMRESPNHSPADRFARLFHWCLARNPDPTEVDILSQLQDIASRQSSGAANETETWVAIARSVLNLDEFITRE